MILRQLKYKSKRNNRRIIQVDDFFFQAKNTATADTNTIILN